MICEVEIKEDIPKTFFPPAVILEITTHNHTDRILPLGLHIAISIQGMQLQYWKKINLKLKKHTFKETLLFDISNFLHLKEETKDLTGALNVRIECTLSLLSGTDIAWSNTIDTKITGHEWSLIKEEKGKIKPEGLQPNVYPEWKLENMALDFSDNLSELKKNTSEDPIYKLMYGMTKNQIEFLKEYIQQQPEYKGLLQFKPAIEISNLIKIDPIWSIAAIMMSSVEGYIKHWLLRVGDYKISQLKNTNFSDLVSMMETVLTSKKVVYEPYNLSATATIRHYRNRVLHEMIVPSREALSKIREECFRFITYIESLNV